MADESKSSFLQIRIREDLKDELKIAAELRGLTVSGLLHSLISRAVSESRRENPAAFPDYDPPPVIVGENDLSQLIMEALNGKEPSSEMRRAIEVAVRTALEVQEIFEDGTKIK